MYRPLFVLLVMPLLMGCDAEIRRFEPNQVYALTLSRSRSVGTEAAAADVSTIVNELFGTPNQPRWPAELLDDSLQNLVDVQNLTRAAGAVASDKAGTHRGLFLEHCATCHALAGSGAGPASMLQNPYPRDFRAGIYKWKSTLRHAKPTRSDMLSLLTKGVPGTGMPSFALIDAEDREALLDYVIFLSIRGEVERELLNACVDEFGYDDDDPLEPDERLRWSADSASDSSKLIADTIQSVAQTWRQAKSNIVDVTAPTASSTDPIASSTDLIASMERGRQIFHSQIANCVGCHGPQGNGQTITLDYDDWTKEFSTRIGLTPTSRDAMKPFRQAGALRPRQTPPRNLQDGVFRGGADPETIYRRITQGIAGTPMPGIEIAEAQSPKALTSNQVWDLVNYVQSLDDSETMARENNHR